jgi:gas vesicle protein
VIDWAGAIKEGYFIGGIAGVLLDHIGQTGRKEEMIKTSTSAMEFLARYLEKETTPQDVVVVSTQLKDDYARLANQGKELTSEQIENILNMFKQYKEQDMTTYTLLLEQLQTEDPALFEKIQALLD